MPITTEQYTHAPPDLDTTNAISSTDSDLTEPEVKTFTITGRNDETLTFTGQLLAFATSRTKAHRQHNGEFAPPSWKCSACRWFEVGIYRLTDPDVDRHISAYKYVIHTRGQTVVPDETVFGRIRYAESSYKVMSALTQWTNGNVPRLPEVSLDALEDAAQHDKDIDRALTEWLKAGA